MAMTDIIQPDIETNTLNHSIVDEKEPISEGCARRSKSPSPSLLEASRSEIKASTRHHLNEAFSSSSTGLNIYLGSYGKYSRKPTGASRIPLSYRAPRSPVTSSSRKSAEYVQLGHLLEAVDVNLETYGFEEVRDGFFDASFYRPSQQTHSEMMDQAPESLSNAFHGNFTLSARKLLLQQWHELSQSLEPILTSRSGVKLSKSVLGVFAAYAICLIPSSKSWLGKYNYVIVVSSIINHPGRSLGSQIDGALMTISGTVMGLGWGSLALYVSTSSTISRSGYGGVLAAFLILFSAAIAWLRCLFIRFYQAVLSAGIAICYICLADTSQVVGWRKVFDYGVPWIMGQTLCLVIAAVVFPATGSRAVS